MQADAGSDIFWTLVVLLPIVYLLYRLSRRRQELAPSKTKTDWREERNKLREAERIRREAEEKKRRQYSEKFAAEISDRNSAPTSPKSVRGSADGRCGPDAITL